MRKPIIRGFMLGLATAVLCGGVVLFLVVIEGIINPGADQPTPGIERWAAKTSLRAYLDKNTPKGPNPVSATEENLQQGVSLYVKNCAACHGFADGKKSKIASGMYKMPNTFAKEDWSKEEDGLISGSSTMECG